MNCIDERNKIYSLSLQELTYRQLRQLTCESDTRIGSLLMFFSPKEDLIYIIEGSDFSRVLNYVNKALQMTEERISNLLMRFKTSEAIQVFQVMLEVIRSRGRMKQQEIEESKFPNNKFTFLDNNTIISIKKHGDTAIDILTTGRNDFVRQTYSTKNVRDFELRRIERLLLGKA